MVFRDCLLSFSMRFKIHPWCSMDQNSIPFYGWIIFCCMYRPSIDGPLGYLHFGAVINNAAMILVYKFFCGHVFSFLLGIYLGVESLGTHMVIRTSYGNSMFSILKNCWSVQLPHFTFPPAVYKDCSFSSSLPTLSIVCLFYFFKAF